MDRTKAARRWLLATALSYIGIPYRWGGDDPTGFDCSGLVVECLQSAGVLGRGDFAADDLWRRYCGSEVAQAGEGILVFRLAEGRAVHVAIALDRWFQISAAGGASDVIGPRKAMETNAFIKIRPIPEANPAYRFCDPILALKE